MHHRHRAALAVVLGLSLSPLGLTQAQSQTTLRFGHSSQTAEPNHIVATKFAEEIDRLTKGKVKVQVYPQAQLGDEKALVEQMRLGTVDLASVASEVLTGIIPDFSAIGLPFAFRDYPHAHQFLDGEGGKILLDKLDARGIKGLGYIDTGFRSIGNNKRPITKPEDLAGLKIRVIPSPLLIATQEAMGSSPVPIPWAETISALSQGVVDGVETGNVYYYTARLFDHTKFFTFTNHVYTANVIIMSKVTYDRLPEDVKKAIAEAGKIAIQRTRDYVKEQEIDLGKKIETHGIAVNTVSPAVFQDKIKGIWGKFEPTIDPAVMKDLKRVSGS